MKHRKPELLGRIIIIEAAAQMLPDEEVRKQSERVVELL